MSGEREQDDYAQRHALMTKTSDHVKGELIIATLKNGLNPLEMITVAFSVLSATICGCATGAVEAERLGLYDKAHADEVIGAIRELIIDLYGVSQSDVIEMVNMLLRRADKDAMEAYKAKLMKQYGFQQAQGTQGESLLSQAEFERMMRGVTGTKGEA